MHEVLAVCLLIAGTFLSIPLAGVVSAKILNK